MWNEKVDGPAYFKMCRCGAHGNVIIPRLKKWSKGILSKEFGRKIIKNLQEYGHITGEEAAPLLASLENSVLREDNAYKQWLIEEGDLFDDWDPDTMPEGWPHRQTPRIM